jgi:hypothetical protein
MQTKTTPVLLFMVDISGYTPFMLEHEKALVHGQMIIGGLLETLMRHIDHPLKVVEVQGDALFVYAPRSSVEGAGERRARHLVAVLLNLFQTFRRRLAELSAYSVCRCSACTSLGKLKLKIVAHGGEVLLNRVGDFATLSGLDVMSRKESKNTTSAP